MTQAYPLQWPEGWPRTEPAHRSRAGFGKVTWSEAGIRSTGALTNERAVQRLLAQLRSMKAGLVVISTNLRLRQDGLPFSDQAQPRDPGAAVYFQRKGRPYSLACDRWDRVADNIAAIAKHIEAMRGMERWGVGSLDRIFAGFTALPPGPEQPRKRPWREVLGLEGLSGPNFAVLAGAEAAYRTLARTAHPDAGGSVDKMAELNEAIEAARQECGA